MYKIVENSTGARRVFSITVGTQEGYGDSAKKHTFAEIVDAAKNWMMEKAASGKSFLTGSVLSGEVVYAWPEGDGKAGGGSEPNAIFQGEVTPLYGSHLTDEEVRELLNDLASYLGGKLGQTRVYLRYRDEVWILQAEDQITPTGEGK